LEKKYSKVEILEYYLNGIYFANGHYGIQAAAQGYFSEGVNGLSLSQLVFLCAIPNNPTLYNPITNMTNTLKRRDRILIQMMEEEKITLQQYKEALNETIELKQAKEKKQDYVETFTYHSAIRALMRKQGFAFQYQFNNEEEQEAYEDSYYDLYYSCQKDLYVKGYRIYTSIDLKKQKLLQDSVDDALSDFTKKNEEGIYQMQGAAVCIDNDNGRVIAIVGGRSQKLKGYTFNRGYQSYRQPGSAIKPLIVYTPSFEQGYTPESNVVDERFEGGPRNSGGSYQGTMKLQRAIELSKNTVAWKLFEEITPSTGLSYLIDMNFAKISERDYIPAAALGGLTVGVSPVEMAAAYSTLENDGYYREPTCIVKIMDSEGNEIVGDTINTTLIYDTNAARIMTEALTGVIKKGTGQGLGLTNTISAGKTGTTNDKKDGWFVGYTPYYTTSVWVGYDLPKSVNDLTGASYPGSIWHAYMEQLHTSKKNKTFELYDWRAVLKKEQEEKERIEKERIEKEKALEEETELPEEDFGEDGLIPGTEDEEETSEDRTDDAENSNEDGETEEEYAEEEETGEEQIEDEYTGDELPEEEATEGEPTDEEYPEEATEGEITEENIIEDGASEDKTGEDEMIEDY
jgi:membrane peptidoglycan carboxypeptidase